MLVIHNVTRLVNLTFYLKKRIYKFTKLTDSYILNQFYK